MTGLKHIPNSYDYLGFLDLAGVLFGGTIVLILSVVALSSLVRLTLGMQSPVDL